MTLIDLHTHSTEGSKDSSILPDDLVEQARSVGLDGVCITEHGHHRLPQEFTQELHHRHHLLVIGGMEASTELGHILLYGVESYPESIFYARDLQVYVAERGGILVVAHPFRYMPRPSLVPPQSRMTLRKVIVRDVFKVVTAMETANGWADDTEVAFSQEAAAALRLPGTGGSDAHVKHQVGACVTVFEDTIRDEADFLEALRTGRYRGESRDVMIAVRNG